MLTKEDAKKMKRAELVDLVIADQNRLEYLKDKAERQAGEILDLKNGLEELQKASEILLQTVAFEKGTDVNGGKELWFRRNAKLDGWKVNVKLDQETDKIGVILKREGS